MNEREEENAPYTKPEGGRSTGGFCQSVRRVVSQFEAAGQLKGFEN